MSKEMLINVTEGEECRIAILEDGRLEELYMERTSAESHVGNIYKGRVTNVEPAIQAAFVDFGLERNGFLHTLDVHPQYFRNGDGGREDVGRKTGRRDRPPIQDCLRRGQEVVVQVLKEGIGTKGPSLTTYLSLPGRYLVLMPGMSKMGVSRKIEDEDIRRKLRVQLEQLRPPENLGFIIRTAGLDRSKADLERDLNYLVRLWSRIERDIRTRKPPRELYQESDLVTRTIRDVYTDEIRRVICDNLAVATKISDFLAIAQPGQPQRVYYYQSPVPLFHKYGVEKEIENIHSRIVKLPGGGSLVIEQTEALVAIDVNSGKFRDPDNAEQTAFHINSVAAKEIARQLRLRDLGGVIVCDFIDMIEERHQRGVERVLAEAMLKDRARSRALHMSRFGIIEMTRQRLRPSLHKSVYHNCTACGGSGMVKTPESVCLDAMRLLQLAVHRESVRTIEIYTSSAVAEFLNNKRRRALADMEERTGKRLVVKLNEHLGSGQLEIRCFDGRGIEVRFDADEFVDEAPISLEAVATPEDTDDGPLDGEPLHEDDTHLASGSPRRLAETYNAPRGRATDHAQDDDTPHDDGEDNGHADEGEFTTDGPDEPRRRKRRRRRRRRDGVEGDGVSEEAATIPGELDDHADDEDMVSSPDHTGQITDSSADGDLATLDETGQFAGSQMAVPDRRPTRRHRRDDPSRDEFTVPSLQDEVISPEDADTLFAHRGDVDHSGDTRLGGGRAAALAASGELSGSAGSPTATRTGYVRPVKPPIEFVEDDTDQEFGSGLA